MHYNKRQKIKEDVPAGENLISKPHFLYATSGDSEGEINLNWEPVKGANTYLLQKSAYSKGSFRWTTVDIVAKSSYTVSKLKSRHIYWFRVAAVSSKGQSRWSDLVQKKVP